MLERDKKTIEMGRGDTGTIRATIVEREETLRQGTRPEAGRTLKITRIQSVDTKAAAKPAPDPLPEKDAARALLDLLREDATPEPSNSATSTHQPIADAGEQAAAGDGGGDDAVATPARPVGQVETIEEILRRDATPENDGAEKGQQPAAPIATPIQDAPRARIATPDPTPEAPRAATPDAPETNAPDATAPRTGVQPDMPVSKAEDHVVPPVAEASFADTTHASQYDIVLTGETIAPETAPEPEPEPEPELEAAPQLPAQPAPRPGWRDLATIPFRSGGNDALRAQMYVAGSDERVIRVIDDLRTQLLRSMQTEVWNRIAITSPTSGCGASFTALNLALSISRIPDFRTILMDLNQRNPSIARDLRLKGHSDMQSFLRGDIPAHEHLLKYSDTLALGLNTERARNPSEILHARSTGQVLDQMIDDLHPDIVLYDLPAMLEYDDVSAFLPQVDGVLLVADATRTLGSQIEECERRLAGKTPLLGVILNRARRAGDVQQAA